MKVTFEILHRATSMKIQNDSLLIWLFHSKILEYDSFKIVFTFKENDYFTNTELKKEYIMDPDILDIDSPSLESATGTEIDWKPGKNLCVKEVQKKQKAKSGKRKGEVVSILICFPENDLSNQYSSCILSASCNTMYSVLSR